jgi:hypothetical protein
LLSQCSLDFLGAGEHFEVTEQPEVVKLMRMSAQSVNCATGREKLGLFTKSAVLAVNVGLAAIRIRKDLERPETSSVKTRHS